MQNKKEWRQIIYSFFKYEDKVAFEDLLGSLSISDRNTIEGLKHQDAPKFKRNDAHHVQKEFCLLLSERKYGLSFLESAETISKLECKTFIDVFEADYDALGLITALADCSSYKLHNEIGNAKVLYCKYGALYNCFQHLLIKVKVSVEI